MQYQKRRVEAANMRIYYLIGVVLNGGRKEHIRCLEGLLEEMAEELLGKWRRAVSVG